VIPVGSADAAKLRAGDSLRYQLPGKVVTTNHGDELLFVKLRYKAPGSDTSTEFAHAVPDRVRPPSTDFTFASAVAAFGMLLRDSDYKGDATIDQVLTMARRSLGTDREGYRAAFVDMVLAWQRLPQAHVMR
jgi:Ca-activated chloride channel family protein